MRWTVILCNWAPRPVRLLINSFFLTCFIRFSSVAQSSCPTLCNHQASLSITNSQSLLKLMSIESVMPSNHLILCRPLLLPSVFASIRVFSSESALWIRWPKYWSFSFNISPSSEHSGLISFRMDWLDLLAVQGTFKRLSLPYSLVMVHGFSCPVACGILVHRPGIKPAFPALESDS